MSTSVSSGSYNSNESRKVGGKRGAGDEVDEEERGDEDAEGADGGLTAAAVELRRYLAEEGIIDPLTNPHPPDPSWFESEECAEYARAKAAIEDAEREHKKKYPDAPAAPERARAVPFGHLRVCHDASPFDNGDGGDADEDDGELGELEGGGFDISDEGALAVKKPKKRGFGGGFGRGFLN